MASTLQYCIKNIVTNRYVGKSMHAHHDKLRLSPKWVSRPYDVLYRISSGIGDNDTTIRLKQLYPTQSWARDSELINLKDFVVIEHDFDTDEERVLPLQEFYNEFFKDEWRLKNYGPFELLYREFGSTDNA